MSEWKLRLSFYLPLGDDVMVDFRMYGTRPVNARDLEFVLRYLAVMKDATTPTAPQPADEAEGRM
jgi:hypothetical protein